MRRLIFALLLLPHIAFAQWGGGFLPKSHFGPPPPATCAKGAAFVDGCPGAPAGAAQVPALLSSYAVRPPWNVAGVDYRTGPPTGTVLVDPATISMTGVTVNTGTHTVTITGNNVTLSGYNFGLANGWTVNVNGVNDTIQNSLFTVGSNHGSLGITLNVNPAASNFSFLANEVNGANIPVTVQQGFTLGFQSTGTLTIQYNYLHNSGGDMVEIQDGTWTNQKIRYNYFENIGYQTDHSDTVQWCGSILNAGDMAFNTFNNPSTTQSLSGEGLLVLNSECGPPIISQTSNIQNVTVRNNTLISKGPNDDFDVGQTITQDAGTALGDHNATYNNYADPTGVNNFTGSPWFPMTSFNTSPNASLGTPAALHTLVNMLNNTQIAVPSVSAKQGGYYVYPDLNSYSPCICDIFSITPSPASGNITTGNTVTFTMTMDAPTTVTGTPTLTLSCSGCVANYTSGSGTKALTFVYTVQAGQTATNLGVTAVNP